MNKIKPIIFSTLMVEAINKGLKTQTRRVCNHQFWSYSEKMDFIDNGIHKKRDSNVSSRYQIGDVLWVRETWNHWGTTVSPFIYKSTDLKSSGHNWKPSIHMPFDASRTFLKVTDVRLERLQDISDDDSLKEGIEPLNMSSCQIIEQGQLYRSYILKEKFQEGLPPFWSFNSLWCKINGSESWENNPYVFVYDFEVLDTKKGTCALCGCTDLDCKVCIEKTGSACHWANANQTICSACR